MEINGTDPDETAARASESAIEADDERASEAAENDQADGFADEAADHRLMAQRHRQAALRLDQATRRLLDQEERERADAADALAQQLSSVAIEDELERGDRGG